MKHVIGILLLNAMLLCINANATNYYFSSSTGNDSRSTAQAQSSSTPWKTLSKLNSIFSTLKGGDIVYFKRGDVFYGSITVGKSGSSGAPITFDAYGTGSKPIITGLTAISSWTSLGSGRYSNTLSSGLSSLNVVVVNGAFQPIGRYPKATATNGGYLTVSSFSGNTSISSSQLSGIPSFVGGQVVIRKVHWILDKGTVNSQSSSSVSYSSGGYNASTGFGFFFQNHVNACTSQGDWCYTPSSKKITVYWGSSAPPANTVQAATIDVLVTLSSRSYITFNNLAFVGSNSKTFSMIACSYVTINACDFSYAGIDAINVNSTSSHLTVSNCTGKWTNNDFLNAGGSTYWTVTSNTVTNTGSKAGMGSSGDGTYTALYNIGANSKAQYNNIINTGYTAIDFRGSSISILNNFVDTFCRVKDDGGALYSYTGSTPIVYSQRTVSNNIVLDGGGAGAGTTTTNSDAYGVYMDNLSSNVTISGNTIANCGSAGIFLHANHSMTVTNNTLYNDVQTGGYGQVLVHQESFGLVRNLTFTGNIVVSKMSTEVVAYYWSNALDLNLFGTFDNNYYCRPMNENSSTFAVNKSSGLSNTNLGGWQSISTMDVHSKKSPKTITNVSSLRFEYNATNSNKTVSLGASYMDMKGTTYASSITLAPYASAVLVLSSGTSTKAVANTTEVLSAVPLQPSFMVTPNPVVNNFAIELNNEHTGKMNVQIVNESGQVMRSLMLNKDQTSTRLTMPASDLPTGVYFVHVQVGDWSDVKKILKQ